MISRPVILAALGLAIVLSALSATGELTRETPARTAFAQPSEPSLEVEPCLETTAGETFELDIVAKDVTSLLAWEVYFAYDRDIVRVVGKDVRKLLATAPNSNVTDFSDPVPNATGLYRMAAADLSLGGAAENGEGVLTRLTIEAKAKGVSPANIFRTDLDGNGAADFGPTLSSSGGVHLGDANGNAIFDGALFSGQIAVDSPCRPIAPTPKPEDLKDVLPSVTPVSEATPGDGSPTPADGAPTLTSETLTPSPTPRAPEERTQGPIITPGGRQPPRPGGSGGGITPWLISIAGGSAGLGLAITYFVLRTARRPV